MDIIIDLETNQIFLIELNCRFQGSTFLINKALLQNKLPILQEINILAFQGKELSNIIQKDFNVPWASVIFYQNADNSINISNSILFETEDDNLSNYISLEPFSYLRKEIYKKKE